MMSRKAFRWSAATSILLIVTGAALFGVDAALLLIVWLVPMIAIFVLFERYDLLQNGVIGFAVCGVFLVAILAGLEVVFRLPAVSAKLGGPHMEAQWWAKYEGLWKENILEFQSPGEFRFRSPYENVDRPEGVKRILALGDSFTWGDKIGEADDVWPGELEKRLSTEHNNHRYQVVNMGQGGFTTANEAELLRRVGWQFEPNVVLVQFYVNDAYRSSSRLQRVGTCETFGCVRLIPWRFRDGPGGKSALLSFVERQLSVLLHPVNFHRLYESESVGWQQMRTAFAEMGEASRSRGIPIILIIFPAFWGSDWSSEGHPHAEIHRKVKREARASGLEVLDLTPHFARLGGPPRQWWATDFDSHPNEDAHEVAATAIYDFLEGRGYLTTERGLELKR